MIQKDYEGYEVGDGHILCHQHDKLMPWTHAGSTSYVNKDEDVALIPVRIQTPQSYQRSYIKA